MARIACIVIAAAIPLFASDTITLRDGSVRYGTFLGSSGQTVTFGDENGARQSFDRSQIQSIQFDPAITSRAVSPEKAMIPSGSEFAVRTNEPIQANAATTGKFYSATVQRDVTDSSGRAVIPRGSTAQMVVRDISTSGPPELALGLQSVNVNGRTYNASSQSMPASSQAQGANTGVSSLGTVVAAFGSGGRGAMGALAGAATGAGVQVLTRGKAVSVPAETTLTFRLNQPLYLKGM